MNAQPITKVANSRLYGPTTSAISSTPSNAVAVSSAAEADSTRRLRSTMSAMVPANNPNSSEGKVLAVCTSATMRVEVVSVAISQAASVVCSVKPSAVPTAPK